MNRQSSCLHCPYCRRSDDYQAFTEWTPRVTPLSKGLKSLVKGEIADNHASLVELYSGVDLLPPDWGSSLDDPDSQVHMIAIASDTESLKQPGDVVPLDPTFDAVVDDDWWLYYTGDDKNEDFDYGFDDDRSYVRERFLDDVPQRRKTLTSSVSPKTWTVFNAPLGFCDGSAQSRCNRSINNTCLLANHNHYRAGIIGHGKSGKLVLSIPFVKEGIILARFDWELEDGPRVKYLPPDFRFEFSINNGKKTSLDRNKFNAAIHVITPELKVFPLLMDKEMSQKEGESKTVEIELQVFSEKADTRPLVFLSHIYYA